tara:strand:- start:1015 stop:1845 length:831 start_codon:yes stop_codon:yes gene_type:complete
MFNISKVAVAMSVYKADKINFLKLAINSLLTQTYSDITIFIAVDGSVHHEVKEFLDELNAKDNFFISFYEKNEGLATRLNQLIEQIIDSNKFKFIARMDADDICADNRIYEQVNFLQLNEGISVVGSDVIEINELGEKGFYKKMEANHSQLINNIIKKCPFNHPTVLFRISIFIESKHRYRADLLNTQDYYLWIDLGKHGYKFANINEPLLYFRIDNSFHKRRGLKKAKNDFNARLYAMNKLNMTSVPNLVISFMVFGLRVSPPFIKKIAYKYLRN